MSEQAFEWKLTPTERRIAEIAFASTSTSRADSAHASAMRAIAAVCDLRGAGMPAISEHRPAARAMLDELCREPDTAYAEQRWHWELRNERNQALAERDRYLLLLKRVWTDGLTNSVKADFRAVLKEPLP